MNENKAEFAELILDWDDFYWQGHASQVGALGQQVEIHVETKDEEQLSPHQIQVDVWKRLQRESEDIAALIGIGLFDYYCRITDHNMRKQALSGL